MPLKCICQGEIFICDFKRHFDTNKNLVQEVNKTCEMSPSFSLFHFYRFCLKEHAISKKYGFMVGEYLEIIFKEIKRTKIFKRESIYENKT